tara:strand:+ start:493 stop:717 length:225 start_codon:yes stop_codon:yes gene_type:complete
MLLKQKPKEKSWSTAKLFHVYLSEMRLPLSGLRYVFAVVGHKWVRVFVPFHNIKFKINRSIWNKMDVKPVREKI